MVITAIVDVATYICLLRIHGSIKTKNVLSIMRCNNNEIDISEWQPVDTHILRFVEWVEHHTICLPFNPNNLNSGVVVDW